MRRLVSLSWFFVLLPLALLQSCDPQSGSPQVLDGVFSERLRAIAGEKAVDCGTTSSSKPDDTVAACGLRAFQENKSFYLGYHEDEEFSYGLGSDSQGNVFAVNYDSRGFPAVAPTRHTQLMDDNHTASLTA